MTNRPTKRVFECDEDGVLQLGWEEVIRDNDAATLDAPFPIHELTGYESDLEAAFPSGVFGNCLVWVNHSTLGWILYHTEDNGVWRIYGNDKRLIVNTAGTWTQVVTDQSVRFAAVGDDDFLPAASWAGKTVTIRNDLGGNVNLDPNGSEQIYGDSSAVLANGKTAAVYSSGSELFASFEK